MRRKMKIILLVIMVCLTLAGCGALHIVHDALTPLDKANFEKKTGPQITKIYRLNLPNQVKVDSLGSDLKFEKGKTCKIIYQGGQNLRPQVTMKDNTLTVIDHKVVRHSKENKSLTIEMPVKALKSLIVKAYSGNVDADKIIAKKGQITSFNGDIKLSSLKSKAGFKLTTENGDIKVDNCNAKGFHLSTVNGDIHLNNNDKDSPYKQNLSAKNLLTAHSNNGDVSVN